MSHFFALESQQLLMIGAATIVGVMLLLRVVRQRRDAPAVRPLQAFQRAERVAPSDEANMEMMRWEVQMHDTARELKAEIDSKMVALQVLIRQAEQQCQRLEHLLGEIKKHES